MRVIATAGSPAKLAIAERLGAHTLIDYRQQDFVSVVDAVSSGRGADLIFDTVGGPYLSRNIEALAIGGLIAVVGVQGGSQGSVDLRQLMSRQGTITSSALKDQSVLQKKTIMKAVSDEIWPLVASGRVSPLLDPQRFELADIIDAHRYFESGSHVGKVLLTVSG